MSFGQCAAGQYSAALWSVIQGNLKWRACPGAASAEKHLAIVIHSCFIKAALVGCGELLVNAGKSFSGGKIFFHYPPPSGK